MKSRTYQSKNDGRGGTGCDKLVTPFEYTHIHIDSQGNEQSFQSQAEITKEYESIFFSTFDISADHPMGQSVPAVHVPAVFLLQ